MAGYTGSSIHNIHFRILYFKKDLQKYSGSLHILYGLIEILPNLNLNPYKNDQGKRSECHYILTI